MPTPSSHRVDMPDEYLQRLLRSAHDAIATYVVDHADLERRPGLLGLVLPSITGHLAAAGVGARLGYLSIEKSRTLVELLGGDRIAIESVAMRGAVGGAVSAIDACAEITASLARSNGENRSRGRRGHWTLGELANQRPGAMSEFTALGSWTVQAAAQTQRLRTWRDALAHRECLRRRADDPSVLVLCRDPEGGRIDHGMFTLPEDLDWACTIASAVVAAWVVSLCQDLSLRGGARSAVI